jgi:uncharacterized protein (TIGR04255 family)
MLNNLPEPSRAVLARSPLQQASFAVAWTQEIDFTSDVGVRLRARLQNHPNLVGGVLTTSMLQTFALNAGGVERTDRLDGWQVTTPGFSVSMYPSAMVVEDRAYATWEAFVAKIRPALEVLPDLAAPRVRNRIMLRYSNILIDSEGVGPACWRGKIRREFLGAAGIEAAGELVSGSIGISTLQDGTQDAQLRTNIGRNVPGSIYTIDVECNERAIAEYDADALFPILTDQNTTCLRLFQMVLEPEFFAELQTAP